MNASSKWRRRAPERPTGFILPTVLVTISIVTLIFLVAMTAMASLTKEASEARARVRFLQDALTLEARLAHLATTERLGPAGLLLDAPLPPGEFQTLSPEEDAAFRAGMAAARDLRFDGRPYRVADRVVIRVRDQAGLINISRLSPIEMGRLMTRLGASETEAGNVTAALVDYLDPDSLRSLNGAEASDYPPGTAGPANRPLRSPDDFLNVLGVRSAIDPPAWRALRPVLTADHLLFRSNVNTAGTEALQVVFGLTESQAQAAIRARERQPFNSLDEVVNATGAVLRTDVEIAPVYASGRSIYTVQDIRSRWTYTGRLVTTPSHPERPFWIDLTELGETQEPMMDLEDAPEFPAASS